jgi:hypothetical protein
MSETKFNIAVLIDGDNAQAKFMKEMLEEVSKYGKLPSEGFMVTGQVPI